MQRIQFSRVEDVDLVLSQNKAVRLLRKEHAPLIIAFLWGSFKEQHRHTYPASELTARLSDLLFSINDPEPRFPREARYYLETWTQEGFLRQYYEDQADEASFELTPAAERALLWITELEQLRRRSVIPRLKMSLVSAGDRVNKTTDRLVEQLRRFLQSRAAIENKRVAQIINEIEQLAIQVKDEPPKDKRFLPLR